MKHFRFHSNSRGADEIKDLAISIDFHTQKYRAVTPVQNLHGTTTLTANGESLTNL